MTNKLSDTKFARETQSMDRFVSLLRKDEGWACYGPKECEAAIEQGAVGKGGGTLLISNRLFRSQDIAIRKRWVKVVDDVKEQGGEVRVLSDMHESGQRLETYGDIAVITTYPILDLDEELGGEELPNDEVPANGIEGRSDAHEDVDFL